MKNLIKNAGLVAIGAVIIFIFFVKNDNKVQTLGDVNLYGGSFTNSISSVATRSSSILAANSGRQYVKCTNMGSSQQRIDVSFGATASKNWGFPLYASQSFEIKAGDPIWTGAITGVIINETGSTSAGWGRVSCVQEY